MKTSLLCHSLLLAMGLSASTTALAQHDHSDHATHADTPAQTETDTHAGHAGHGDHAPVDHSQMQHNMDDDGPMDHSDMDHGKMDHAGMDHGTMDHGAHAASAMPREPIPVLTDADRAAAFPVLHSHDMSHGSTLHSLVLFNRLEAWDADPGTGQAWEAQAWIGGDINRLWLRSKGERERGSTSASNLEVLYGRSVSPWWDVVAGIRHDFTPGTSQSWAAFGLQGMAPYMFEISATAYLGESGQVAANLEVEYELLLTNRLILQPVLEFDFNSKDDPSRQVGSGLGKAEAGLRLRYELSNRRLAPYVGIAHERMFGRTADLHRAHGEGVRDTRVVAGIRFWF